MCPSKIKALKGTFKVLTFGKPKHEVYIFPLFVEENFIDILDI